MYSTDYTYLNVDIHSHQTVYIYTAPPSLAPRLLLSAATARVTGAAVSARAQDTRDPNPAYRPVDN